MNNIRNFISRFAKYTGRIAIAVLIAINLYALYMNAFIPIVHYLMVAILFAALYMMTYRVKYFNVKEQIASSVIELSGLIMKVSNREELFDEILNEVVKSVRGGELGSLIIIDEHDQMSFVSVVGYDLDAIRQINLKLEDTFLYRVNNGNINRTVLVNDIMSFNKDIISDEAFECMKKAGIDRVRATISSPLLLDNQLIGMINVDSTNLRAFSDKNIDLVESYSQEISKIIGLYQMFEKTLKSAKYDHLTNALSRGNFMNIVDSIINERHFEERGFSICYIDLDKLKQVNDKFGHDLGDQYIKRLVDGIQHHLKGEEIISRFGGDEFVVLLFRNETEQDVFHRVCLEWFKENPVKLNGDLIEVKYSFGTAHYPKDAINIVDLINKSDERMYFDKQEKRKG